MALSQSHVENIAKEDFCPKSGGLGLLRVKQICFVHSQPA
jgi:hypothetical protein